jgi:hypothetical protein
MDAIQMHTTATVAHEQIPLTPALSQRERETEALRADVRWEPIDDRTPIPLDVFFNERAAKASTPSPLGRGLG